MSYISKYELEALGEPLGGCVTTPKLGGGYFCGGGGGGGPSSTTVTQSNIPEWLAPQIQTMLGAATEEFFTTEEGEDGTRLITGIKPYTPYSEDPNAYVAPFTGLQNSAFEYARDVGSPWEYGSASNMALNAGLGGYGLGELGVDYGGAGFKSGLYGQQLGAEGGGYYGGMGAGYGSQAAGLAGGAANLGELYERLATTPEEFQRYMSPYQQAVIERQKSGAIRDKEIADQSRKALAARSGAFGGARQAIEQAEAERALQSQLQGIEAQGLQQAYQQAQGNILNRAQLESQGLGQAGQLYGVGMQGAGVGLQGLQAQLAGTAQGMQGAGMGLQGVQSGLSGYGLMGQMGSQLGALGGQRLRSDMDIANMRYAMGQQQQQAEQQKINQAIQDYARAQERPYDLLSMYNALIRGYSTPGQTVSQYQAPASTASQLAGLGTAGIGLSALSRAATGAKAGGVIKENDGIDRLALRDALAGK
jgi:hypothetical protein